MHKGARCLDTEKRKDLAIELIQQKQPIVQIAANHDVSRKFAYSQKQKALTAINDEFNKATDNKVLFYLPVTKNWLFQFILVLVLCCRSSIRGVIKATDMLLDINISVGTVHNVIYHAIPMARNINEKQDLSAIKAASLDEVFHHDDPVLTGIDNVSTYCFLLALENQRDGDTWAIHLLDLQKQGLNPNRFIVDNGSGLHDGLDFVFENTPRDADHFHGIKRLNDMKQYFRNRYKSAVSDTKDILCRMEKAKKKKRGNVYSKTLSEARRKEYFYKEIFETISILISWMQHDILQTAGGSPEEREMLYDFIIDELALLATKHKCRIHEVVTYFKKQKPRLLAFAHVLDSEIDRIIQNHHISRHIGWQLCQLQRYTKNYETKAKPLMDLLGEDFYYIQNEIVCAMSKIHRTSSMVENLNGRLNAYLYLRKHIGQPILDLLRFFLNHSEYFESDIPERKGKTPAQMLTGKKHPHWLEMLGYTLFKRTENSLKKAA